jgi:hypothetical protein
MTFPTALWHNSGRISCLQLLAEDPHVSSYRMTAPIEALLASTQYTGLGCQCAERSADL